MLDIRCQYHELADPRILKPHPKNPNEHTDDQIDRLIEILKYQGWRNPILVSRLSGYIVSGHGRLMAALEMGEASVPVTYQDFADPAHEYAHLVADNALNDWSFLNLGQINVDISEYGPDFNLEMLGIKDFTVDVSEKGSGSPEKEKSENICSQCGQLIES
jgi:hypothetical protein